jgi:membrane protein required for colicin V production
MIAKKMGESSKSSGLGGFDRLLGLGFGALKGLLAATVGFLFATLIADTIYSGADNRPGWMVESRTYPLLNASSSALVDFVNERRNGENAQPKP